MVARRERNEATTWAAKAQRVRSPIDEAAHEWDRLRARIRGLKDRPAEDQQWSRLADWLRRFGHGP